MKMKMEQTCGRNNQRMKMRVEEIRKKTRKRDGKIVKERKEGQRWIKEATGKRKNNQNCWCITEKGLEGDLEGFSLTPPSLSSLDLQPSCGPQPETIWSPLRGCWPQASVVSILSLLFVHDGFSRFSPAIKAPLPFFLPCGTGRS